MDFNPKSGRNGKKIQTTEVMGMDMDMAELAEGKALIRTLMKYLSHKQEESKPDIDDTVPALQSPYDVKTDRKSALAQRKAFNTLSKMKRAGPPKGTVGPDVPMEIRVKQMSLFPGIY